MTCPSGEEGGTATQRRSEPSGVNTIAEEIRAFRGEYKFAKRKEGRTQCYLRSGRAWGRGGNGKMSVCLEDKASACRDQVGR